MDRALQQLRLVAEARDRYNEAMMDLLEGPGGTPVPE